MSALQNITIYIDQTVKGGHPAPPLHPGESRQGCLQLWCPQHKKDMEL